MGRKMLAAQDLSIRADTSSGPLDLLTLSEHSMSNTMSPVQRSSEGHCSGSVVMLFQSTTLSGREGCVETIETEHVQGICLVRICNDINSVHSE